MKGEFEQGDLRLAYQQAVHELMIRHTRVGYVLVLVLMPVGGVLDHFMYPEPELFWPIIVARLICVLVLTPLFVVSLTAFGRRHIRSLSSALVVMPVFTMCWMIYLTEGEASSYYAGLNLMIIGACQLLPYTGREAAVYSGIVMLSYTMACVLRTQSPMHPSVLFNNLFFVVLTSIICVTACHYATRRRISDFRLRHDLDQSNKQLAQSYDQLAEMDRLKSQFFANISHELRTPLTLILSPIESLLHREPPIPEDVGHSLVLVKNNGLRLLKLINDLLEIIRLEEGRLQIEQKPINLSAFTAGIADSIRQLVTSKSITLHVQTPSQPIVVRGDPSRLEKVLLNLLTNAIKFTSAGGRIEVHCSTHEDYGKVEVHDTGIGISQQELPFIFDRFRQADGSSTRKYQGVGLGLALAKELIEEHNGRLTVQSRVGHGTTLVMTLPLHSEASEEVVLRQPQGHDDHDPFAHTFRIADRTGPVSHASQDAPMTEVGQGPHCILIVDDEADMRQFLVSILAEHYRVLQAADGTAGLKVARQHKPDLVLLDLMLPGMDGLDVCRALKKDPKTKDIKIVLLTARVDEGSKIEALERGADDFLTKPFSSVEIRTRLRGLMRTAALQRDLRHRNAELEGAIRRLKSTEAQLVQSEKMNALGSLAAGLLHEINNPLNYTLTALQLLQELIPTHEQADDDGVADILGDIEGGMKRIRDIISDLRAFAYPQQAQHQENFDLQEALDSALRFTSHLCNGQTIQQDLAPNSTIVGSKTHVSQVLVNLVTNALRAVEPIKVDRQPIVRIGSERNGTHLKIHVWDNGIGIDPEVLSRIFDPFFTTRDVGQGMGLGLSICHTIVTNHHGRIQVVSEKDRYTEVTFELPLTGQETP